MPKEKEVEIWADEPENDEVVEEYEEEYIDGQRMYSFNCKPCYNFQSIEFNFVGTEDDVPEMMEMYAKLLEKLQEIAPDQSPVKSSAPAATEKQLKLLKQLGVKTSGKLTMEQAKQLIKEKLDNQ